ncbi:helicase-associated domain-containing protein [Paenibacillus caseinilyticus]|uniref:helicase-associated domain-containing protein n=1 Tax=Paenibacillus caseinilyticus TaxID=3098138 RepID=UPI0022B92A1C|nr:helicase-associated domain-containing protein [Paenibacillus caseinilyticus]MCZ8520222.1 helicase-associated domain-containing protein [Paenibacillus caseinilyticus]
MNYAELARRMPRELRSRMERETVYAPWLGRGLALEAIWTDKVVMETVYNRMGGLERSILQTVVRRMACEPFDSSGLERAVAGEHSGAEARAGLAGLLRKGILFAFRKTWGEHTYLLPADGFALWQDILFPGWEDKLPGGTGVEAEGSGGSGVKLRDELFSVLVASAQQGLKLTKHGTLHKKQLGKLAEHIRLNPGLLRGAALKYAYGDTYPLPVAVLLDLMMRLGLIVPQEEELVLQREPLQWWLTLPAAQQNRILYGIWRRLVMPGTAPLQHAVRLLEKIQPGGWFPAESVSSLLHAQGILEAAEEAEDLTRQLQEQWIAPLTAFGWMEEGRSPSGPIVYRWTERLEAGEREGEESDGEELEEQGQLMVQPDFDILVPPDVTQAVRWELACLADFVSWDHVSLYKLTRSSVRRALEQGRTADELVSFLAQNAMYGLPENVEHTLQQWARPFGKTRIVQAFLLRCADEETAEAVAKQPELGRYVLERAGSKDFIIAGEELRAFSTSLEKAGFMAALPQASGGGAPAEEGYPKLEALPASALQRGCEIAEQGLIYSRHSVTHFQMESSVPEPADLYPRLGEIPAAWLRDYRSYHGSTRREMIEKAIELQTSLQLRWKDTDLVLVPRKMQDTRGTWSVTGYGTEAGEAGGAGRVREEIRLLEGEWQEMKLILPGINDKF